jgi:TonB family protein
MKGQPLSTIKRFLLPLIIFVFGVMCYAQQGQNPGIDLYKAGKYAEARAVLSQAVKDKASGKDPTLWNYLGLAYLGEKDNKNARKAFEKAVSLEPLTAVFHTNLAYANLLLRQLSKARSEAEKVLALEPQNVSAFIVHGMANFWEHKLDAAERDADQAIAANERRSDGYLLKYKVLVNRFGDHLEHSTPKKELPFLQSATNVIKTGVDKCGDEVSCKELKDAYEGVIVFLDYFSKRSLDEPLISANTLPPPPEPGVTPLKILTKPRPKYTDIARQDNTQGTIIIAVLFGANGTIQQVLPLKRLGDGLDEEAVKAARGIKFEPMMRDGKPVAVVKQIEYTFSIY